MAKTTYIDILPALESQYFSGVRSGDRFMHSRVARKITLLSRKKKQGLSQKSMLPQVSALWDELTEEQKTAWSNAGAEMGLNGWRLFVQDTCARIINDLPGTATPSLLHQSWVGDLKIEAPAEELKIVQIHPHFYWVSQKVVGKKGMYSPVLVTEDLALPITIGLNYKANLSIVSSPNFAKFYARFWHSYQGADNYTDLEINLNYSGDWQTAETELTELLGYVIRYDLYFHIKGLRGDLYCDNIKTIHSSQNWVRDAFCKDINQGFTRAFYQIPKHWSGVVVPDGAGFESIYQDF